MRIVWNSFDGRYSDSPRALHEALRGARTAAGGPVEHTWLASPGHRAGFPDDVATAPTDGPAAVAALEAADLVVSNTHLRPQWRKAPGATYLQTWHGTPLKHIAADEPRVGPHDPVPGHEDVARWDLLLSSGPAATAALRSAFRWSGPVAETGWPRNDVLVDGRRAAVRERVRGELGVPEGATAVLYTPTWRDDVLDADGRRDLDLRLDLQDLSARLGGTHVLLLRLHYMLSDRLGPVDLPGVLDVSAHPDVAELYCAADAMVTDYSSTLFDFAVTDAPLLLFTYDLEHYRDDLRGFYLDLVAEAPGPLLRRSADVVGALADPVAATAPWAARREAFRDRWCPLDDGRAVERVLAALAERGLAVELPHATESTDVRDTAAAVAR